jgi:hypothetical protein
MRDAYTFATSLASSLFIMDRLKLFSLAIGSMMRSFKPRHQDSAPAMGGWLDAIGGFSRSVRNSSYTRDSIGAYSKVQSAVKWLLSPVHFNKQKTASTMGGTKHTRAS